MKAEFSEKVCSSCPFAEECSAQKGKKYRTYRFDKEKLPSEKRKRNIRNIPSERRTLRANVEATVKEFAKGFNSSGKIKTRGKFKATLYAIASALSVNIGRIYRFHMA